MIRKLLLSAAVAVVVAAAVLVPLPFVVLTAGPVIAVDDAIELARTEDPLNGEALLTTVRLESPTAVGAIAVLLDDDRSLRSRDEIIPPDVDLEEFTRRQERIFEESTRVAAAVGQRAAGLDVRIDGDGAIVVQVLPGAPADGHLESGDVITAVAGQGIRLASEISMVLADLAAGDTVTLGIERDGEPMQVEVELGSVEELEQPGLGIAAQTRDRTIELAVEVEVERDEIGGPSAGLMIALTVYDLLDEGDLLRGRAVAGTGTIDPSGRVGPVAGVAEKVAAAVGEGASVFLAPAAIADEARGAAGDDIEVVAVSDLDDAIEHLGCGPGS